MAKLTPEEKEERAWEKAQEKEELKKGKTTKRIVTRLVSGAASVVGSSGTGIRSLMPRGIRDPNTMVRNQDLYVGSGGGPSPAFGRKPSFDKSLLIPSGRIGGDLSRLRQSPNLSNLRGMALPGKSTVKKTRKIKRTKRIRLI